MPLNHEDVAEMAKFYDARNRLIAQAPAMYELLKEVEWFSGQWDTRDFCPFCHNEEGEPHRATCRLAAVLKAVEGE